MVDQLYHHAHNGYGWSFWDPCGDRKVIALARFVLLMLFKVANLKHPNAPTHIRACVHMYDDSLGGSWDGYVHGPRALQLAHKDGRPIQSKCLIICTQRLAVAHRDQTPCGRPQRRKPACGKVKIQRQSFTVTQSRGHTCPTAIPTPCRPILHDFHYE